MAPALDLSSSSSINSNGTTLGQGATSDHQQITMLEEVACACLNVRVKYRRDQASEGSAHGKVRLAEDGVTVALASLVGKELAQVSTLGPSSLPRPALRCLHCSTSVYAVEKALSSGPARSIGFRAVSGAGSTAAMASTAINPEAQKTTSPAKDVLLRPHDGYVYLLPESIGPEQIKDLETSEAFSPIYGISVSLTSPSGSSTSASEGSSSIRPSLSQSHHRHSSYGQYTSASQFGLQGLPSSLIASSGELPRNRSPSFSIAGNHSGWVPPQTSTTTVASSSGSPAPSPLATQLDFAALERLRQWRYEAEQEIVQMVRAKRKEFDDLIKRAKLEGEVVLERVKTAPAPVPVTALMASSSASDGRERGNGVGRDGRSRDSSLAAPERSSTDRSSSEAALVAAAASREVSRDASPEASPTLSDEAFQRRPTQVSRNYNMAHHGSTGAHISSSLSALSASFAMRGRDAPSAMDDWVQKRRLKERYPEGDHSVMTSAATSAANSYSDQGHLADIGEIEEEERRGRGRERAPRNESPARAAPTASEAILGSTPMQNIGSTRVAPGTVSRPTMAPSSLNVKHFAKRPPITSIDTGADMDNDTPRPGGPLGGLASPSAQVHLRPRNPPPSGAEPLKPATRKSKDSQSKSGDKTKGERQPGGAGAEKKVAFAETTDQAASRRDYSDSEEEEEQKPLVDERGTAVFDIDEELEGGGDPIESRADAFTQVTESVPGMEDEKQLSIEGQASNEEDVDDDDEGLRSDGEEDDLGGMRASVGARQAGSFAALAEFGRTRAEGRSASSVHAALDADAFDPASIRLDGRVVVPGDSSPKKRSGSRSREISRDQMVSHLGHFDGGGAANDKRRGLDWDRRKTAIGYRATIGDAELRLSGLLAPHAPSHRSLWIKERRKNERKYILTSDEGEDKEPSSVEEGGDKLWFAWQQRAKEIEDEALNRHRELVTSSNPGGLMASSMPADRGTGPVASAAISISRQSSDTTTTIYDETSGFDREPKTSLPYQERQMVPSLRKATRRPPGQTRRLSQLPTIPDAELGDDASRSAAQLQPSRPRAASKADVGGVNTRLASPEASRNAVSAGGALPGSVVTKGFGPDEQVTKVTNPNNARAEPSTIPSHTRGLGLGLGLGSVVGSAAQSPLLGVAQSGLLTGHSTPGSRSPSSVRRSPRPPYVPPPPPTSTSIVLQPDPLMKPGPLRLFTTPPDLRFAYNEEGEEEETDWAKVMSFMHRVERLKTNKRTGWIHHRVPLVESIADHMYRMAILAMLCPNERIDLGKCVMLALVHDLAEAEVGDLTPLDGVPKEEKTRRESEALAYLVHDLLGSSPAGLRIEALWHEYEDRQTMESRLVKDLDRFELLLQALEYEGRYDIVDLQPFFSCAGEITHPRIRRWAVELAKEREALWSSKGDQWAYKQKIEGSVSGETGEGKEEEQEVEGGSAMGK